MSQFSGRSHARRMRNTPRIAMGGSLADSTKQREDKPAAGPAHGLAAGDRRAPDHEQIAKLAYSYWEARGRQNGSTWEDWFRAERALSPRSKP